MEMSLLWKVWLHKTLLLPIIWCPKPIAQPRREQTFVKAKKKYIPRNGTSGLIAHTSLRVFAREDWYFDSGCSRHMIGVNKFLVDIKPYSTSYITFGDGSKGEKKGVGKLDYT